MKKLDYIPQLSARFGMRDPETGRMTGMEMPLSDIKGLRQVTYICDAKGFQVALLYQVDTAEETREEITARTIAIQAEVHKELEGTDIEESINNWMEVRRKNIEARGKLVDNFTENVTYPALIEAALERVSPFSITELEAYVRKEFKDESPEERINDFVQFINLPIEERGKLVYEQMIAPAHKHWGYDE